MSTIIRTGNRKNILHGGGGGYHTQNLCLFTDIDDLQDVDADVDIDVDGEFDIIIDDSDNDNDNNNNHKTTKLINDCYYFNNSTGRKYIFKIKHTKKIWKLNDIFIQNMDYLYKTSRNFGKLGGTSTNIFDIDSTDISYFLHYYYMYAVLDTLNNENYQLSEYTCSVINSLYKFIEINNEASDLNKKIKLFLNLFQKV